MQNAWEIRTTSTNFGGEIAKEEPLPKLRQGRQEALTARLFRLKHWASVLSASFDTKSVEICLCFCHRVTLGSFGADTIKSWVLFWFVRRIRKQNKFKKQRRGIKYVILENAQNISYTNKTLQNGEGVSQGTLVWARLIQETQGRWERHLRVGPHCNVHPFRNDVTLQVTHTIRSYDLNLYPVPFGVTEFCKRYTRRFPVCYGCRTMSLCTVKNLRVP
jgi:hypothetical protein